MRAVYNTEVEDTLGVELDKVTGVKIEKRQTQQSDTMTIDLIVIAIGNKSNTELFRNQLKLTSSKKIITNKKNSSSIISGFFAAGDVTDMSYGRVVIPAGQGAITALDAVRYLNTLSASEEK